MPLQERSAAASNETLSGSAMRFSAAAAADEVVDGHPLAGADGATGRHLEDDACRLVAQLERVLRRRNHAVEEVQFGAADTGAAALHERPTVGGGIVRILDPELASFVQQGRFHFSSSA
jgi:hypothetical protein